MYLTYDEYKKMGGTLDEPIFDLYSVKCQKVIDRYTAKRIAAMSVIPQVVKYCMYEIIQYEVEYDSTVKSIESVGTDASPFLLKSFTTDGYTESYAVTAENSADYAAQIRRSTDERVS